MTNRICKSFQGIMGPVFVAVFLAIVANPLTSLLGFFIALAISAYVRGERGHRNERR